MGKQEKEVNEGGQSGEDDPRLIHQKAYIRSAFKSKAKANAPEPRRLAPSRD
jgi:hypothetical protein